LNGNAIDVANSKYIMAVRRCFHKAEKGVHFDGYVFATYGELMTSGNHSELLNRDAFFGEILFWQSLVK
jgi:hypothetical protein